MEGLQERQEEFQPYDEQKRVGEIAAAAEDAADMAIAPSHQQEDRQLDRYSGCRAADQREDRPGIHRRHEHYGQTPVSNSARTTTKTSPVQRASIGGSSAMSCRAASRVCAEGCGHEVGRECGESGHVPAPNSDW